MQKADGMNYAPRGKVSAVCRPGEFRFAAVGLDHGHIYGMCNGLTEAGGELVSVYDPDPAKVAEFCKTYPSVKPAASEDVVLNDPSLQLIASAPVPCERGPLGLRAMDYGKGCNMGRQRDDQVGVAVRRRGHQRVEECQ